ncbi:MAG: magnesium transporter CorA family protein [Chloroflexi bacterium]|nr:magnesium transporter CorA family protein [Chloroflexota bacterium]
MIKIFKNSENGLQEIENPETGCWIKVIDPTAGEKALLKSLEINEDYLVYSLDPDERARIEKDGHLLILLRIPYYGGESEDIPFTTITLGIIITDEFMVTICKQPTDILDRFALGTYRGFSTTKFYRFVLQILLLTANTYLQYLHQITRKVDALEDNLEKSTRNKEVLGLLKYQKSLTHFTTALKSNELMMKRLQNNPVFKKFPEDEDLLEDVLTETQQAIETTNIQSNILSGMMDAFASIISNNLNGVMKFLASVTIIISLPTMIASFFGMNLDNPLAAHPWGFTVTVVGSLVIAVGVGVFFGHRDWL